MVLVILAETDRVSIIEQGEPIPVHNMYYGGDELVVTYTDWFGNEVEERFMDALAVGFSGLDKEPLEVTEFTNEITLAPGETVRLQQTIDAFSSWQGIAGEGFMLVSLNDDFRLVSPGTYQDDDGTVVARVVQEQQFDVVENGGLKR